MENHETKIGGILSKHEVTEITSSWIYKSINEYLDNEFVKASRVHGNDRYLYDPLHLYIRLYVLDKDTIAEDEPENVILKYIFKTLINNVEEVCAIIQANADDINKMYEDLNMVERINMCDNTEDMIFNKYYSKLCDLLFYDYGCLFGKYGLRDELYDKLYYGYCSSVIELIGALSYSIIKDCRWKNYFELINTYKNQYVIN